MTGPQRFRAFLVGFLILHVLLAATLPLSGDEAYYWDCSRHLDWSYFDQPPLVIWAMVPFRAVFGERRLAVRAPAIVASLVTAILLLGLALQLARTSHRRVKRSAGGAGDGGVFDPTGAESGSQAHRAPGGERTPPAPACPALQPRGGEKCGLEGAEQEAGTAYLLLHGMPLFFIGSFYASTDVVMATAYLGATWAAVALARGKRGAWWGFGIAIGLGFLAKFPAILVLPALAPALIRRETRRDLATATPYRAAGVAFLITAPVWIWGALHGWDNIAFQLAGRHSAHRIGVHYVGEFIAANLLLATPFLFLAVAAAWWQAWRRREPGWTAAAIAVAVPFVAFGAVALRERVGAHWGGPGLLVGAALIAVTRFRGRRTLMVAGTALGLLLSAAVVVVAAAPEALAGAHWSYRGRPQRISTDKLAAAIGNREIVAGVTARLAPGELVASESYSTVHLLAFLSRGSLPTRLAHIRSGKHGLASLYWYRPSELRGRNVLFVTERTGVTAPLERLFESVEEEAPLVITRSGREVRRVRLLRCRNLRYPEGAFTRLSESSPPSEAQ